MPRLADARPCHRAGGSRGGEMAETISPHQRSARLQPQPIMTMGAKLAAFSCCWQKCEARLMRSAKTLLACSAPAAASALSAATGLLPGNGPWSEADNLGRNLLAAHRPHDVIRHAVGHFDERQVEPLEDIAPVTPPTPPTPSFDFPAVWPRRAPIVGSVAPSDSATPA